jgi:hypothetical protein
VPDLAAILEAARVPIKVSCVVNEHNADRLDGFLARCHELGIRRVVLRQLYDDPRWWPLPWRLRRIGAYRDNPVYDYRGMEVTFWRFDATASASLNLFSDGTISEEYLLTRARSRSIRADEPGNPSAVARHLPCAIIPRGGENLTRR